jgi:glutathione S-transferase
MIGRVMSDQQPPQRRPVLVTIPISHYCEKARWALDRAEVAYEERRHLPALHRFAVRRAGGGMTAPVLVCDEVGVLGESRAIVEYADARAASPADRMIPADPAVAAEAHALADDYDARLGPATRLWVYHEMFDHPELVREAMTAGVPGWQRTAFRYGHRGLAFAIAQVLGVDDVRAVEAERTFRAIFTDVSDRLADGRPYLAGDVFSIADLTFAALSAPLIAPPQYGVRLPPVDQLPPGMVDVVEEHRETRAGRHALAMFRDERMPAGAGPAN